MCVVNIHTSSSPLSYTPVKEIGQILDFVTDFLKIVYFFNFWYLKSQILQIWDNEINRTCYYTSARRFFLSAMYSDSISTNFQTIRTFRPKSACSDVRKVDVINTNHPQILTEGIKSLRQKDDMQKMLRYSKS